MTTHVDVLFPTLFRVLSDPTDEVITITMILFYFSVIISKLFSRQEIILLR